MSSVSEVVVQKKIPLLLEEKNNRYVMPSNAEKFKSYKEKFEEVLKSGAVKLIIFDLDGTFWKGTLAEVSDFEYIQQHHNFVKNLVSGGIMCSICSFNDYKTVQGYLQQQELWDYFIFPQISVTSSKGAMIQSLLSSANLRSENAIFVDDEYRNIEEAKYSVPGLFCITPEFIFCCSDIILPSVNGIERLNQYKILEKKVEVRKQVGSEQQFLKLSQVSAFVASKELDLYLDRVCELMQRTNMLNFTKRRDTKEDLAALLISPSYLKGVVRVTDIYGDYGIVGFFAMHLETKILVHFFFSCRIMNMGVEKALYHDYLNTPTIEANEATDQLQNLKIKEDTYVRIVETDNLTSETVRYEKLAFIQGSCTLHALKTYIEAFRNVSVLTSDWSLLNIEEITHTQSLLLFNKNVHVPKQLLKLIPNNAKLSEIQCDYFILETHQDARKKYYRLRNTDIFIPFGDCKWTAEQTLQNMTSRYKFTQVDVEWWNQNMELICDMIPPSAFRANLQFIRENIPEKTVLVLLTHSEVGTTEQCIDPLENRIELNKELEDFAKSCTNVLLLDIRKYVTNFNVHTKKGNISSHYTRDVFWKLAEDFNNQVATSNLFCTK